MHKTCRNQIIKFFWCWDSIKNIVLGKNDGIIYNYPQWFCLCHKLIYSGKNADGKYHISLFFFLRIPSAQTSKIISILVLALCLNINYFSKEIQQLFIEQLPLISLLWGSARNRETRLKRTAVSITKPTFFPFSFRLIPWCGTHTWQW